MHPVETTRAATDVSEFVTDIDGGQFEHMLSIALSEVAAAVVDREKKGQVEIKLEFERIAGTHQVRIGHTLKFTKPTTTGKVSEHATGASVLHVGKQQAGGVVRARPPRRADAQGHARSTTYL
jgi:hypothetical protein